jgi:hypothetical protein
LWPAPGDYDDGEFGGMKIGRGNRSIKSMRDMETKITEGSERQKREIQEIIFAFKPIEHVTRGDDNTMLQ